MHFCAFVKLKGSKTCLFLLVLGGSEYKNAQSQSIKYGIFYFIW